MNNPRQYKIPDWFLNRQKDVKDGKFSQVLSNGLDNKLREDLERLKKIRAHRYLAFAHQGIRMTGIVKMTLVEIGYRENGFNKILPTKNKYFNSFMIETM
jgi:hypothetical protein